MPENKPEGVAAAASHPIVFNGLRDVEWRIGVTTSSSATQQVGQTFVQVKMLVETGSASSSSTQQTVQVEMSVPKFYSFLSEMEKVKASLGLFK